jgi:hypothetical protein
MYYYTGHNIRELLHSIGDGITVDGATKKIQSFQIDGWIMLRSDLRTWLNDTIITLPRNTARLTLDLQTTYEVAQYFQCSHLLLLIEDLLEKFIKTLSATAQIKLLNFCAKNKLRKLHEVVLLHMCVQRACFKDVKDLIHMNPASLLEFTSRLA